MKWIALGIVLLWAAPTQAATISKTQGGTPLTRQEHVANFSTEHIQVELRRKVDTQHVTIRFGVPGANLSEGMTPIYSFSDGTSGAAYRKTVSLEEARELIQIFNKALAWIATVQSAE